MAKGSVALNAESLSVKKRAPCSASRPGLVKISTPASLVGRAVVFGREHVWVHADRSDGRLRRQRAAVLKAIHGNDGLPGSSAAAGGEHLQLSFEVIGVIRHALKVLGSQRVCAGAVVGIDRDSTVFSYLDVGVNIRDAQMNREVRGTLATHLAFGEALGVDGHLVRVIAGRSAKRNPLRAGRLLFVPRRSGLQLDVSANDGST